MKCVKYIAYFFYIAFYWNIRLALIVIKGEIKGEKKYNIDTTGHNNLDHVIREGKDIVHATIYMPISFTVLEAGFEWLKNQPKKHFVDIGCGKGRAMAVALAYGFEKITGIDFSQRLILVAQKNMDMAMGKFGHKPISLLCEDAKDYIIPDDADCIFLFNPFDEFIMHHVVQNISKSLVKQPRNLTVLYANPLYKERFVQYGFQERVHIKKYKYLEMSILEWKIKKAE